MTCLRVSGRGAYVRRMRDAAVEIARDLTYILERGTQGSHVLFSPEEIRDAFALAHLGDQAEGDAEEAEDLVKTVAGTIGLEARAFFIGTLSRYQRGLLIRRYFEVLDDFAANHGIRSH